MMPLVRFVSATDPVWLGTLDAIRDELTDGGLVTRYRNKDGLDGGEGSVLGHSDGSVTAIYNWYVYVREMHRVLEIWANELMARPTPLQNLFVPTDISHAA
jgi:GH15 family glucan-1,4-alpha-glucosidase